MQFFFPDREQIKADYAEAARYLGYRKVSPPQSDVQNLIVSCCDEMHSVLMPKSVFEILPLTVDAFNRISFADLSFESVDLSRNLEGCSQVAIFATTLGPQVDALIRRYERIDTVKAAILQSVGAMFAEVLVEQVNDEIKKIAAASGKKCKPRYSPGYGDVPLQFQKEFFRLLPCTKIGLTLMDTLIMSPEKSVTAFVGIFD
ncbi:MAG: hypothetical protein K6A43_10310 [Treponema sp.]|nr:hypothetical protein [Treponema sp.]